MSVNQFYGRVVSFHFIMKRAEAREERIKSVFDLEIYG